MVFTKQEFLAPLKEFLEHPPFLAADETLEIDYLQLETTTPLGSGAVLSLGGMALPRCQTDITGGSSLAETLTLGLLVRRFTNHSTLCQNSGDFIINFIRWVNFEQQRRGTSRQNPRLPAFGNGQTESIAAFGGKADAPSPNGAQAFRIQLLVQFTSHHTKQEDDETWL